MLKGLLHKSANKLWTETDIACDPILHAIHSIIRLVGVKIQPFAETLLPMVRTFMYPGNLNGVALKTLSAIMYSLKTSFHPFATDTFSQAPIVPEDDHLEFDFVLYLLQILRHLVIFRRGSQRSFLREISKPRNEAWLISSYAIQS
jgi:hypothetical protein